MRMSLRTPKKFDLLSCRSDYFKKNYFSSIINEWNKLDPGTLNSSSETRFRKALLKFNKHFDSNNYSIINDPREQKLPTRLHLAFS